MIESHMHWLTDVWHAQKLFVNLLEHVLPKEQIQNLTFAQRCQRVYACNPKDQFSDLSKWELEAAAFHKSVKKVQQALDDGARVLPNEAMQVVYLIKHFFAQWSFCFCAKGIMESCHLFQPWGPGRTSTHAASGSGVRNAFRQIGFSQPLAAACVFFCTGCSPRSKGCGQAAQKQTRAYPSLGVPFCRSVLVLERKQRSHAECARQAKLRFEPLRMDPALAFQRVLPECHCVESWLL